MKNRKNLRKRRNKSRFEKLKGCKSGIYSLFAEREGFEPPDLLQSTVFKTAAFDHSAISLKLPRTIVLGLQR